MSKKPKGLSEEFRKQLIIDWLRDKSLPPPTFKEMAVEIGHDLDEKTIRRDIEDMRKAGADIVCKKSAGKTVYVLNNDFRLPHPFSADDLISLTILRQAIRGYSGTYLEKQLDDISRRIAKVTMEQREYSVSDIDAAITFRPPPVHTVKPELWEAVLKATLEKCELTIKYSGRHGGGGSITIWPYHMFCSEGEWYLLAGMPKDFKPVQYSLARMTEYEVGPGNAFKRPKDFKPRDLLEQSFRGFISTGPVKTVKVRVTGFMVRYVKDRVFQPKQKVVEMDGGKTLEISFPAGAGGPVPFGNVASWVLGMGPCAKVLEPPELVERVRQEARELLDLYEKDGPDAPSWD